MTGKLEYTPASYDRRARLHRPRSEEQTLVEAECPSHFLADGTISPLRHFSPQFSTATKIFGEHEKRHFKSI